MGNQMQLPVAHVLLLALLFRVGLGFGHGPMVSPVVDPEIGGYCGTLPDSDEPEIPYQGCPVCHALSYCVDFDHGLAPVQPLPQQVLPQPALPAIAAATPLSSFRHRINLPRAPPAYWLA
jgi:hypothetical protein